MTTVTLDLLPSGSIARVYSSGHAGYAAQGEDIVCAGISAILQTAVLGLREYLGLSVAVEMQEGELELILERDLPQPQRGQADIVLGTMRLGLESLRLSYPDHLQIIERRCR
jgi:uncharacterized protein YsxB (DUF464 family)